MLRAFPVTDRSCEPRRAKLFASLFVLGGLGAQSFFTSLFALGSIGVQGFLRHCELLGALVIRAFCATVRSLEPWRSKICASLGGFLGSLGVKRIFA